MAVSTDLNGALLKLDFDIMLDYLYQPDSSDLSLPNIRIYPMFKREKAPTKGADEKHFSVQTGGFESLLIPHAQGGNVNKRSDFSAKELTISASMFAGGFEVTQETEDIAKARGKDGIEQFVKSQTQRMMKAYDLDMDSYFANENSTGTGILAQVNGAVTASTSVIFNNPTYIGQFRVGQYIDIYNGATKQVDSIKIVDVNFNTNTLTMASAVTCADNAYIYKEDTKDAMFDGLFSIVNNTAFQGLNPATSGEAFWQAVTVDGGTAALSEAMIDDYIYQATNKGTGVAPRLLMLNWNTQKKMKSLLLSDRVINDPVTVKNGFKIAQSIATNFGNIPYMTNRFWQTNTIMGLDTSAIHQFSFVPFTWKKTGGNILRPLPGKLDSEALFYVWFNFATDLRNVHSKLTNYTT